MPNTEVITAYSFRTGKTVEFSVGRDTLGVGFRLINDAYDYWGMPKADRDRIIKRREAMAKQAAWKPE